MLGRFRSSRSNSRLSFRLARKKSILIGEVREIQASFLHRFFEEALNKSENLGKLAVIYEDYGVPKRETTFRDLNQTANQIANLILNIIKAQGNQAGGSAIGVCMKHSDNLITALLAIWKTGSAYLPIDVDFPQNRVEYILNEAKPVLVIHDDFYRNSNFFSAVKSMKFGDLKRSSVQLDSGNIGEELSLKKSSAGNQTAVIAFTSGSSGVPKGVKLSHAAIHHRIQWQLETYPFNETEQYCIFKTPLSFVDHIGEMWCPLFTERTLVVIPKELAKDPERFVKVLEKYKIERVISVPTLLRNVLMHLNLNEKSKSKKLLPNFKMWISSGEILTMQLAYEFFNYFDGVNHRLVNFYGCTELIADATSYDIYSKDQLSTLHGIPVGFPVHNSIVYVLDEEMKPVDQGEIGEIHVAGVNVCDGYVNKQDDDKMTCKNPMESVEPYSRMYRTGDFGCIIDGLLYFEGRRDSQIKIRGHRVDVSEVEKIVNELGYVDKCAILVHHVGQVDQALVAFITLKDFSEKISRLDVIDDLKARLVDHMIPQVKILDEFPFLENSKVDRQELLKLYQIMLAVKKKDGFGIDLDNVRADEAEIALQVFQIIAECLGKELRNKISIQSHFFEMGGNSLNSIYTVTKLHEKGFYINIGDFLEAQNLEEVLTKVSQTKPETVGIVNTKMKLVAEPLNDSQKEDCMQLLAKSFLLKGELDQFIPNLKSEHYVEILTDSVWSVAVNHGLSFMVKNESGDLLGVAMNFDLYDEPLIKTLHSLGTIFEFLESIERPILQNELQTSFGDLFHTFMMGAAENLDAKENINVTAFMELEIVKLATAKGFKGIFTTNTSPLTQHLCQNVLGYETLLEVLANQYVDHTGEKPFVKAPDEVKALVMHKSLEE